MKIRGIISILLLTALTASAQIERKPVAIKADSAVIAAPTADNKIDKQSSRERMKNLDLTREQRAKLKEIMQANKAAKEAIHNNTQLSDQEKKRQLRDLQKQQAQKTQAILTPEQIAKFKAGPQNNP